MKYYKDTDNNIYAFEDNVTDEIIKNVENIHNTKLTEMTQEEYEEYEKSLETTFDDFKLDKLIEIKSKFTETIKAGFTCSNGIKMNADITDISKLKAGVDLALSIGATTMDVRDYENKVHNLTIDEVNKMLIELGGNYQKLLKKKWDLEKQANSATTTEELDAVSWD